MILETALLSAAFGALTARWQDRRAKRLAAAARARPAPPPRARPAAPPPRGATVRAVLADLKTAISGTERQQQQMSIDDDMRVRMKQFQAAANRNAALYGIAAGVAVLGAFVPSLSLLAAGAVLYLTRDIFIELWRDLRRGHVLSLYLMGSVMTVGMLLSGQVLLTAFWGVLGNLMATVLKRAETSSQKQLIEVFAGHPAKVWVARDGLELEVDFATLAPGELVVVGAGEVIPVDGIIAQGQASIDQQALTGEGRPVERGPGERVFAATLVLTGRIQVQLEASGAQTVAAGIGSVLNRTENYTENMMARGREVAERLLPVQLALGALTWPLQGSKAALAVLWSGLGGQMGLLGPLSVLNYLQFLSRAGILVKDGRVLESLRQVDTVVFDKTGTLTLDQPTLHAIHCAGEPDPETVLRLAAAAEQRQPHPLARAILSAAAERGLVLPTVDAAGYSAGYGLQVQIDGHRVLVGSARFLAREGIAPTAELAEIEAAAAERGHSLVCVGQDERLAGVLELAPTLRPEAQGIVAFLHRRGIKTCIISGDHEQPTRNLAERLGIDDFFAETLPEHKADHVQRLRAAGRFVCFVGDGINDAIALKSAQISISLKGASTAATDTAQIVLMDGTLGALERLFVLADEFERTMHTNFLWSVVPGALNTAGVWLLHFGVATSMGIFYATTFLSLGHSMRPLIRHRRAAQLSAPDRAPAQTGAGVADARGTTHATPAPDAAAPPAAATARTAPEPTLEPTLALTPEPEPTLESRPEPTLALTLEPVSTPEPTVALTPEPKPTLAPTLEPKPKPEPKSTPKPPPKSTPKPKPKPKPKPTPAAMARDPVPTTPVARARRRAGPRTGPRSKPPVE